MPDLVVLVVGTATEIGKTWVTAAVARALRDAGLGVAARKPVQSFDPGDPPSSRDAAVLGAATGEAVEVVCRPDRSYELAMAPPMAADALGRPPITIGDLLGEITWPDAVDVGFVETAGGVRSPLAGDADAVTLADALRPDLVLLVADAGLGTINAVRLCVDALRDHNVVVYLNRFDGNDDLHRRNRVWLVDHDALDVVTDIPTLTRNIVVLAAQGAARTTKFVT